MADATKTSDKWRIIFGQHMQIQKKSKAPTYRPLTNVVFRFLDIGKWKYGVGNGNINIKSIKQLVEKLKVLPTHAITRIYSEYAEQLSVDYFMTDFSKIEAVRENEKFMAELKAKYVELKLLLPVLC